MKVGLDFIFIILMIILLGFLQKKGIILKRGGRIEIIPKNERKYFQKDLSRYVTWYYFIFFPSILIFLIFVTKKTRIYFVYYSIFVLILGTYLHFHYLMKINSQSKDFQKKVQETFIKENLQKERQERKKTLRKIYALKNKIVITIIIFEIIVIIIAFVNIMKISKP